MRVHLRDDALLPLPAEAVKASAIAFLRIFLGIMWLFEVTVGHNWKIGGLASDSNPRWMGPEAGEAVREASASAIADGTYSWFAWLFDVVVIPNATEIGYLVIGLQLLLGVCFIIGIAVRPLAVAAIVMDISILMLGNSMIPPLFLAMHLFVLVAGAGHYFGADGWILERTRFTGRPTVRAVRWLIHLPVFERSHLGGTIAVFGLLGVYFLLTIGSRTTDRFALVALELVMFSALIALGLYAYSRYGDRLAALAVALRIFVGFQFLEEIWARTATGYDALPGWASADAQVAFYDQVVSNHWNLFAVLVDALVVHWIGFWVVLFGLIQAAVGAALLVGYRVRLFGLIGLGYLAFLIGMGFTRLAPFLFGLLVVVVALDGGRIMSVDSVRRPGATIRFGLPIPAPIIPVLIVLAAINAVAAATTAFNLGLSPDAYVDNMIAVVTAIVAILSGTLAFAGWLQRHPSFDHSGEMLQILDRSDVQDEAGPF